MQSNGSILLMGGSATLNNNLNVPGALSLTVASGTSLSIPGTVSGAGTITSSGGIISLPNATGLTGGLNVMAGTVENAGLGAPLTMGRATFRVTADTTYAQPISRSTGGNNNAMVFDVSQGVTATVSGKLERGVGALLKTGGGTLRLTYPGTQYLCDGANNGPGLVTIGADGNGPTSGCFGTTIANGKLLIDGGDRQTNIVQNGRFPIGTCTTANGTETTGELEIRSGTILYSPLYVNSLTLGRNNGKTATAPDGLSPTLTVSGGKLIGVWVLALGYYEPGNNPVGISQANTTCRPVMHMTDGLVDTLQLRMSEAAGITSSITMDGGEMYVIERIDLGFASNTVSTLTINNGNLYATNALIIMTRADTGGSTATLNLNGGAFFAPNIRQYGDATCTSHLYLNGGTFYPTAANTLTGLTETIVGPRGAFFDTTYSDFTIAQSLLHDPEQWQSDGGLTKHGENTLTLNVPDGCTYDGPTTVMTGTLRVMTGLPSSTRLVVESGSTFQLGGASGGSVAADSITFGPSSTIAFEFPTDSSAPMCDYLSLNDGSGLTGTLEIRLLQTDGQDFSHDGTYTLFMFSEGTPDVSTFHVSNPAYGKGYSFEVTEDNRVTLTIWLDESCAVWNRDADGAWNRAAFWTQYPGNYAGAMARFDNKITAPRTIAVSGITAGALWFNNEFSYTLSGSGGMTLENTPAGEPAYITVENGSHAISAPLTLASPLAFAFSEGTAFTLGEVSGSGKAVSAAGNGTLTLAGDLTASSITLDGTELSATGTRTVTASLNSPGTLTVRPDTSANLTVAGTVNATNLTKSGASILNLTDAVAVSGQTTVEGGTLSLVEPVESAITLKRATLRATETMTLPGAFTRDTGNNNYGAVIAVDEEKELTLSGRQYVTLGAMIKTGKGTLRYTYNGTQTINNFANDAPTSPIVIGANGEGPTGKSVGITVAEGRIIFDAPLQTNYVNGGRVVIGGSTTTQAGAETAGELEVRQGTLIPGAAITVGRNNGNATTAPDGLESKLLITGGNLISSQTVAAGWWDGGHTGFSASTVTEHPWIIVTNGLLQAAILRIAEGNGVGPATLDVSGGTLRWSGSEGLTVGYGANSIAVCNLSGIGLIEPLETSTLKNIKLTGENAGASGTLNLNGGTLRCGNIVKGGSAANCTTVVNFNGGVFRPIVEAQTLTGLTTVSVSTNGAVFDLSEVAAFTVSQPLLHNEAAATDGGVVKRGTGTLTLSATTSTFNGPLKVEDGTLVATVCSTNALDISAGAVFDANGETAVVGGLSGCGTAQNGTLAVTGRIAPDTNASGQSTLTVDTLRLDAGATFVCDWRERSGTYTCPTLAVGSSLTFAGRGCVDFGMGNDGAVLPSGFSCVLMTYETGSIAEGTAVIWAAENTGITSPMNAVLTARDGKVTVTLRSGGTVLSIR